jgi:hypothetical protein
MRKAVLALWAFALTTSAVAGELYVLPVVADGVAGRFGSLWETQIRIVKINAADTVVIRRAWVCLEVYQYADTHLGETVRATVSLPPFGWRQANFPLDQGGWLIGPFQVWSYPRYGVMNLAPQSELPYYAYVSVVYTSPVGASTPRISDPYLQFAQPGQIIQ